ncbi:MAG: transcriptional regulator [Thermodesulfobacteriota bacterium]
MATIRQQIIDLLTQESYDVRELSQALRISEKEVASHLDHVNKSVASQKRKLQVNPATCAECGFTFKDRKRLTKPSRCPKCKSQRIQSPRYRVV